jgi:hypothetical protein
MIHSPIVNPGRSLAGVELALPEAGGKLVPIQPLQVL